MASPQESDPFIKEALAACGSPQEGEPPELPSFLMGCWVAWMSPPFQHSALSNSLSHRGGGLDVPGRIKHQQQLILLVPLTH